jgi:hypothetical protein
MKLHTFTLLLCLWFSSLSAQRIIKGTIKDKTGDPIIGANVLVKGASTGATSNDDGTFQINAPKEARTLVFSYIGYEMQEIALGISNEIDVVMMENNNVLTDVVVTGRK